MMRPHISLFWLCLVGTAAFAQAPGALSEYQKTIKPLLTKYCFDCHGDGMEKGGLAFDAFASEQKLMEDHQVWKKVMDNVRAGIMPPPKKKRPNEEEKRALDRFIKYQAFAIDPANPDPGRVTLRRLNRIEYQNTIRDLMGVEFKAEEEFPPDDTGYGFDNIGDVLSVSPLLLEKYMAAAETIVRKAVPATSRMVREQIIAGSSFRSENEAKPEGRKESRALSFYEKAMLAHSLKVDKAGDYKLELELVVRGDFAHDPGRAELTLNVDGRELLSEKFKWENGKKFTFEIDEKWEPGEKKFTIELTPLTPREQKQNNLDLRINSLIVRGPLEREKWDRPNNWARFFTQDAPDDVAGKRAYAKDVLAKFTSRAFRRPADQKSIDRLVTIAESDYTAPGKTFEEGMREAMVAVLASPRFLFRSEQTIPESGKYPLVDEYALASRLSYFIWSTMPDQTLLELAAQNKLREQLPEQLKRMLADSRASQFVENFVGQWLQTRDVEGISIDSRAILARDRGADREIDEIQTKFRELRAKREEETRKAIAAGQPVREQRSPEEEQLRNRLRELRRGAEMEFTGELRRAMRRETELCFDHVVREDRPILELLDADYTYLNEPLAKHYGIPGVTGTQMRRVTLPADSPRGGILTHGSVLVVTSNPTRTSPVKRGLFILDNILDTPTLPPPPDVPELEEARKEFKDKEPSLREMLEVHRAKPLCSSCHDRMDPLGLALENFNAMGMFRTAERKQEIVASGQLATGESFASPRDLKKILVKDRKLDFYRCLTEKLMTYALGRGPENADIEAVDQIVERLDKSGGKFSALLSGIVESAPFQRRRNTE